MIFVSGVTYFTVQLSITEKQIKNRNNFLYIHETLTMSMSLQMYTNKRCCTLFIYSTVTMMIMIKYYITYFFFFFIISLWKKKGQKILKTKTNARHLNYLKHRLTVAYGVYHMSPFYSSSSSIHYYFSNFFFLFHFINKCTLVSLQRVERKTTK